jgi:NAD+ synthase (glutamine-hydrolysing)
LLREDFLAACDQALLDLAARAGNVTLVVGHPRLSDGKRYNSAAVIRDGRIVGVYDKQRLPNYTVFDEERYFEPGGKPCVFGIDGVSFGVNICEDTWGAQGPVTARARGDERVGINICADSWSATAPRAAREAGANVLLVLNASPYHMDKQRVRHDIMRERVAETGLALVYANLVGGQDELALSPRLSRRTQKSTARSSPGCATTSTRTGFPARSSAYRAASTRH